MSNQSGTAFAEIIESSLYAWRAQTWQWDNLPSLGALVTIQTNQRTLFGIIHEISTQSRDSSHYPHPYQKTEEELRREQPQIFHFLQTTFTCFPVGYYENNNVWYQIPPQPPKIHDFVYNPSPEMQKLFFSHHGYLHVLLGISPHVAHLDELLLALLKQAIISGALNHDRWTELITTFSLLIGNDYRRLKLFLQRLQPYV